VTGKEFPTSAPLTDPNPEQVARDLRRVGRHVVGRHLTWGRSGNLSARREAQEFVISTSGARLDDLRASHLATCSLQGEAWRGGLRPSVEVEMHREIYRAVPRANAILHTSAPYTTLLACSLLEIPVHMNTDALHYVGRVARVPYMHPGTRELARAAAELAPGSNVLLLNNHGSLTWGATLDEALIRTEALEFLARMLIVARSAHVPFSFLSDEEVAGFEYQR
jgi:L-fuculose-phosphate aldolase